MPTAVELKGTSQADAPAAARPSDRRSQRIVGARSLRVVWTTPHGPTGTGGMDRLTDLITSATHANRRLGVELTPLTTKGRWGICIGAFVFAYALVRFACLALAHRVDVLHINVAAYGSAYRKMILARLARWLAVPYIVHIHAGKFGPFWDQASPRIAAAVGHFLQNSAGIIVLGREFADLVTTRVPAVRAKVHLLYNATPSRRSRPCAPTLGRPLQLTSLGLLGARKNTTQLIEALGRLSSRADWHATIAGDGEVEKARAQVKALGLADRVAIPGWLDQAAIQKLLENTDIFVLPSLSEGLPMAVLEALSYGIAVVATPVNAIPDVIGHERNGLLVPVRDLDALVAALLRLMDDAELRCALGAQGLREHTERYTLEAYMQRIKGVWQAAARSSLEPNSAVAGAMDDAAPS